MKSPSTKKQNRMKFYKRLSPTEKVKAKNQIFLTKGETELEKKGFQKQVYKNCWYGRVDYGGYAYNYYRLSSNSELECITVHISKGDSRVKIFLNIFKLNPSINNLLELKELRRNQFDAMPNALTRMEMRSDEYGSVTLFHMIFLPQYKVGLHFTRFGFQRSINKLGKLLEKDMANIDAFVKKWHDMHKPSTTDWEGNIISV